MTKLAQRLFLFFIVFPALVALIFFLPQYGHLALNAVSVVVSAIGAIETGRFFSRKIEDLNFPVIAVLGAVLPLAAYLETMALTPAGTSAFVLVTGVALILGVPTVSARKDRLTAILPRMSAYIVSFLYPGLFASFVVRISGFEGASVLLSIFIVSVYMNDAFAYASGMLFGGGNRNVVAVSPNKSVTGFIVGALASPAVFAVAFGLFPHLFDGRLWKALVLGAVTGITTIVGDLVESAMKRSVEVKDSGDIIPGRGGILDSVDSVIFSAPFFYYIYAILVTA
jgi:phosphatidate cytidylyltransferase